LSRSRVRVSNPKHPIKLSSPVICRMDFEYVREANTISWEFESRSHFRIADYPSTDLGVL